MPGIGGAGGVRRLFQGLDVAASGLSAQRRRIEVVAQNIANADTTRTPQGGPYRRQMVDLEAGNVRAAAPRAIVAGEHPSGLVPGEIPGTGALNAQGVIVTGVAEDGTEGPLIYDPSHPDADERGYVLYPNVDLTHELVTMMEARRLYEANATVFDAVKTMLRRAMEI